jgi:hypothetical protein
MDYTRKTQFPTCQYCKFWQNGNRCEVLSSWLAMNDQTPEPLTTDDLDMCFQAGWFESKPSQLFSTRRTHALPACQ